MLQETAHECLSLRKLLRRQRLQMRHDKRRVSRFQARLIGRAEGQTGYRVRQSIAADGRAAERPLRNPHNEHASPIQPARQ